MEQNHLNFYSDSKLIAEYLHGDEAALENLIGRYLDQVYSFIFRYVHNLQEAEDLTQETFVRAWKNLKHFDPRRSRFASWQDRQKKSFKTWLFSIAKNAALDFLKKKKALPFSTFENASGDNLVLNTIADPSPLPDKILERTDLTYRLSTVLDQLAQKYRLVLFLRYNDHFTFREIAETIGESLNTIKSRHRRAIFMLKKRLTAQP